MTKKTKRQQLSATATEARQSPPGRRHPLHPLTDCSRRCAPRPARLFARENAAECKRFATANPLFWKLEMPETKKRYGYTWGKGLRVNSRRRKVHAETDLPALQRFTGAPPSATARALGRSSA